MRFIKKWMPHIPLLSFAAMLLTAGCAGLTAPTETDVPLDITLNELEKKMQSASDPKGIFQKAKSYVQRQVITQGKNKTLVLVQYLAPDKYKIETLKDNQPFSSIILNGKSAWTVNYDAEKVTALTPGEVSRLRTLCDLGDPNESYQTLFASVQLSQCRIEDKEYYKMTCQSRFKGAPPLIIYVGKNSYLIREIRIPAPVDYQSVIKRYALYEGVMIPEETQITQNGAVHTSVIFENKLNAPLEESNFLPPVF